MPTKEGAAAPKRKHPEREGRVNKKLEADKGVAAVKAMLTKRYGTGQPSKYQPDVVKRILDALKNGATLKVAAQIGGIAYDRLNEWRHMHPEFNAAVEDARASCLKDCLGYVKGGAKDQPRLATWLLEKLAPTEYGRQVGITLSNPDGTQIDFTEIGALARQIRTGAEARAQLSTMLAGLDGSVTTIEALEAVGVSKPVARGSAEQNEGAE